MKAYFIGLPPDLIPTPDTLAWTQNLATGEWSFQLPEPLPQMGEGVEYCGPFPHPEGLGRWEGLEVADAMFAWEPQGDDLVRLGVATALHKPIWLYQSNPDCESLTYRCAQIYRDTDETGLFSALACFDTHAPPAVLLAARIKHGRRELSEWWHRSRKDPEAITRGQVYLLQSGDRYKIGFTRDLNARLERLGGQTAEPCGLVHAFYASDARAGEYFLHKVFAPLRRHGEWFSLGEREVGWIKGLGSQWRVGVTVAGSGRSQPLHGLNTGGLGRWH